MGHKYDYLIDVTDDSGPARVVRAVGEGKRVLEIGAGPGSMTRVLREKNHCRVTAVEIDDECIEVLQPLCDRVYRADLNDRSWRQALEAEAKFDVIVAADVLEHLYDPWSTLREMKTLVGPDGYIVVCLPHAGHHAIVASLLDEHFVYHESGLLDRTHIRFFGIKDMQLLFEDAGFVIVDAEFVIRFPEDTDLVDAWRRIPAASRIALQKNAFGLVYQVVIKAVAARENAAAISLLDMPVQRLPGIVERTPRPATDGTSSSSSGEDVRLIAFFLTQFHATPENDQWWGKGFTEWTNVTKAEPLFEEHYQPHLPADLGFYDLRLRDVRHEQIGLAKQYGIDGFCYYYYWFSGTRILHQPLDDMLSDPESEMPFCLCWANENWTRRWDGADREILIAQKHLPNDDIEFIRSVVPFFKDPRYIRLKGLPFLIVYQPQQLPDPRKSAHIWREYCEQVGIGAIHLCAALTNDNDDYQQFGFDSGLQFPPHNCRCENVNDQIDFYSPFNGRVVEYSDFARGYLDRDYVQPNVFRTVSPCWDQTPRVGARAFLALNGTPANYEYWLAQAVAKTRQDFSGEERFVFVNAWNEWAEGCHLEPDRRFQRQFLEATLRARTGYSTKTTFEDVGVPKITGTRVNVNARLHDLRHDLSQERETRARLEQELAAERERLSQIYRELTGKREELANLKEEASRQKEEGS